MKIIAFYSNKGGVGKTASSVNLSYLAANSGFKSLLIDLDPQSSATYYYRIKPKIKKGAKEFSNTGAIEKSIKATDFENLDVLPGDFSHRRLDNVLDKLKKPEKIIRFFSMVDIRKNMHKEAMKEAPKMFGKVLKSQIPYSSKIEQMGVTREPVNKTSGGTIAAQSYKNLWTEVKARCNIKT